MHRSPSRILQSWRNSGKLQKTSKFLPTLDPPGRRTVHLSKSITEIKIVQNNISDNFYFDVNNVQPKLKEVIFYFFKNNGKSSFYRYKKFSPKFTEWAFIPFESWEDLLFSGIKAQTVRILSRSMRIMTRLIVFHRLMHSANWRRRDESIMEDLL